MQVSGITDTEKKYMSYLAKQVYKVYLSRYTKYICPRNGTKLTQKGHQLTHAQQVFTGIITPSLKLRFVVTYDVFYGNAPAIFLQQASVDRCSLAHITITWLTTLQAKCKACHTA